MTLEEIESLLFQATTILGQVALGLQEVKKPQQPAQVMSRIAQAQAQTLRGFRPELAIVHQKQPTRERKERAYHYLRIASRSDATNDKIYRVVGKAALSECNRIEAEIAQDTTMFTERLDSRQFQALVHTRQKAIREGAKDYVGSTTAEDLQTTTQGSTQS
jgi:hypothetical protein